jgi:hypothetical protein
MIIRSILARFLFAFGIVLGSLLLAGVSAVVSAGSSAEVAAGVAGGVAAEESRRPPGMPPTAAARQEVWQAVVAELQREGLSEQQLPQIEDLDLPGALPALAERRLRVSSACWDQGPRRTQFRLECAEPGQCLPFLVYLHNAYFRDVYLDNSFRDDLHYDQNASVQAGSCRLASQPRRVLEPSPKPVLRAGDRATAVFLSNRLRMTASVICLERGREGAVIRVRSQDGHVFRARISGPARLEALPQQ